MAFRRSEELAGQRITVRYDDTHLTASAFDRDGHELPSLMSYWFAWYAFHPDTQVSKASANSAPVRKGD